MAASSSSPLSLRNSSTQTYKFILFFFFFFLVFSASIKHSNRCYTSIFSFGDSIADTGNLARISESPQLPHFMLPPYGETYFHRPTGRCSDGRLVINFIAEHLGLPLVPPYFSGQNGSCINFQEGVNFAVVGATALDIDFFEQRGIHNPFTNCSLGNQLHWFKKMLPSLCHTPSSIIFCLPICFIMTIGNSALILGLWSVHFLWTNYCIVRSKQFGPVLKFVLCLFISIFLILWPSIGIVGSIIGGASYGFLAPMFATFKAVDEGKTDKFYLLMFEMSQLLMFLKFDVL